MPEPSDRDEGPLPDWPLCSHHEDAGCIGIRIGTTAYCLAHLEHQDPQEFKAFFASLGPGASLDLRGTQLSSELLKRVLVPLKTDEEQGPIMGDARFDQAQFRYTDWFERAQFEGFAGFVGAKFTRKALFEGAQFSGFASFWYAQFSADASFNKAQFCDNAGFNEVQFSGLAGFSEAKFSRRAGFRGARFSASAVFNEAQFSGLAGFQGAQFEFGYFQRAQFAGNVDFSLAQFSADADFERAQFTATTALGPLRARLLVLDLPEHGTR